MGKATSRTEKESFIVESLVGGSHNKTTISDGKDKVEARGRDAEEAESRAHAKWERMKQK